MSIFYKRNQLTPIINVSGFMTKIGASITNKKSVKAANKIFGLFVNIDELQTLASKRISKCFGSEAALITASAAGGLTECVAGMMTGSDLKKVYNLPNTKDMKNKVLIQKGHLTNYGAEVSQGILLSGAKILTCGLQKSCSSDELEKLFFLKKTSPVVGLSSKAIICNKVDLPEPDGPVRDTNSPLLILRLTFFKTTIFLLLSTNLFDIFDNLIISLFIF